MSNKNALEAFLNSDEFSLYVIRATYRSYTGEGYTLETFPDGSYKVRDNMELGILHGKDGDLIDIPCLSYEDLEDLIVIAGSEDREKLAEELAGTDQMDEAKSAMRY